MPKNQGRPSPATVIACIALFFALSGSAIALQGRNTVDSGDIKPKAVKTSDIANNAVTTKKIKNNHVRAADIQNNAVGTGEIRNGQVAPADFAQQEAYHLVTLSNGGEGDCIWTNAAAPPITPNPAAFYKDALGEVHLTGLPSSNDGPGGDGCAVEVVQRTSRMRRSSSSPRATGRPTTRSGSPGTPPAIPG